MKLRVIVGVATTYGLGLAGSAGCGDQTPSTGTSAPDNGVYSIQIESATQAGLPNCTRALNGSVGYVASPSGLFECLNRNWNPITCSGNNAGDLAYGANGTSGTQTLVVCSLGAWSLVALPQGPKGNTGPPGPQGPPGANGATGATGATGAMLQCSGPQPQIYNSAGVWENIGVSCAVVSESCCSGACVDMTGDPNNCGGCGNACPSGGPCLGGSCSGGVEVAAPAITTNQIVAIAGAAGCQPGNTGNQPAGDNCAPVSPWYNTFSVFLYDATTEAQICYSTSGAVPACTAGGTCLSGLPYDGPIGVTTSGTLVQAVACVAGVGASAVTSATFTLEVAPVTVYATGAACTDGMNLGFYDSTGGNTEVNGTVAARGGATVGAVICYTTDGSSPGCINGSGSTGTTTCAESNTNAVEPAPGSTAVTGTVSVPYTLAWQTCAAGFVSAAGLQAISLTSAPPMCN